MLLFLFNTDNLIINNCMNQNQGRRPGAGLQLGRARRARGLATGGESPQLRSIHVHQLFRIQYTCFELDAVNVGWWICTN